MYIASLFFERPFPTRFPPARPVLELDIDPLSILIPAYCTPHTPIAASLAMDASTSTSRAIPIPSRQGALEVVAIRLGAVMAV
jgi:hypothetical protein